jgi:type I restriction enzyme S subunit
VIDRQNSLPQLPEGWTWTTLENCIDVLDSQRIPINAEERERRIAGKSPSELHPYYGATGQVGWIDDFLFDEELLLLGEDGAPFLDAVKNKAYVIKGRSWVNNHAHVLRALKGLTSNSFLRYYLNIFDYHGYVTGTTRFKLNQAPMRKIPIPLAPFPEQGRIVAKVEELFTNLDAGVESLKKVKTQLKRYRQAVLKYAFEGKLTEEWRKTRKDQIEPTQKPLEQTEHELSSGAMPELPEEWAWARVGQVVVIIDYRGRTPPFSPEGIPHLRSSNIRNGKIVWDGLKYISEEAFIKYMTRGLPQAGDLLFTTEAPLGEVALAPELKFSVAQRLMILRPSKNLLNSKFLLFQIMSQTFQARLKGKGTGTTVTGVSSRNFKPVELVIAPLAEQERIAKEIEERFSFVDEVEKIVEASPKRAERLRHSILKNAFEGKLVPQDPSDEPAEKLLERIEKEKVKHKTERNTRNESRGSALRQVELVRYVK